MLLDTCAISEVVKPRPDEGFAAWFEQTAASGMYLSALTLGEIAKGCARLPDGPKQRRLQGWLAGLREDFADRIVDVDAEVAAVWGQLAADASKLGVTPGVVDGLIAASALRHGLAVVTRNEEHFAPTGVRLLNPWSRPSGG